MALKKSQLYSSLWQSCDELRGGMDASQYKDYVLTLLFMKYVSDKRDTLIDVPGGGSFYDMVALKGNKEIGDRINKIIGKLAKENDLQGVIDQADFNDEVKLGAGKEMQDRLSKLVAIFEQIDLGANRTDGDDLLGDAYEYLMRHFATESGKSKGQFYTPAEVSQVMAKVVGIGPETRQDQTVYDPTCGSGSLLLKAAYEAPREVTLYGQELENATWALARMNMILHGYETAEVWRGNTLSAPYFKNKDGSLKTHDFAVANPPFSQKAWTNGVDPEHDQHGRFVYGVPPAKNGDYAFLLHLLASLKSRGKGAIILPHGVLFRGHKEADIRRELIRRGFIKGIIGLPPNLFYGTGIPACIVVVDKEHAAKRKGIFMIDASRGYVKDGNKNRLRSQDIHRIVDVFNRGTEVPRYSRMVPIDEIASDGNDYNLNIPRYIDASEPEDLHDLYAHMAGGIPTGDIDALEEYWKVFPSLREELFQSNGRSGYSEARVATAEVKPTILGHGEFTAYAERVRTLTNEWHGENINLLKSLESGVVPKGVIHTLSEDLLARFAEVPLLDRYDVYQRLMDYWHETMQDDVYLIVADGWQEAAKPRAIIKDKTRKIEEAPDLNIGQKKYKTDLIPPELIVGRYFAAEQQNIDELVAKQEAAARELEEYAEEHGGEEGLLSDALNDKGNVTKKGVSDRLKEIKHDPESEDERAALEHALSLIEVESAASKAVKAAQADLDAAVLAKYGTLSEDDIKTLVVEDKWYASVAEAIDDEVQRVTGRLAARVKELEDRYANPLPEIEKEVAEYSKRVEAHLEKMGVAWL